MMDFHRLSRDQFDTLAAGQGGPDAIAALRAGQISKHLVMIMLILDRTQEHCPGLLPSLDRALELLESARRAAPESTNTILGHPQVGLWAARCLRQFTGSATDQAFSVEHEVQHLGVIAAVAAFTAGLPFEVSVPLRDGTVMLPTLGLARHEKWPSSGVVALSSDGRRISIVGDRYTVLVPDDATHDGPGWIGLRRLHGRAGTSVISIELVDLGPARDGTERTASSRVSEQELKAWRSVFDSTWQVLSDDYPEVAAAMSVGLVGVIPVGHQGDTKLFSASMRDAFGYFESALSADAVAFAETIVHEFQHSKLYAVADLFPLHDWQSADVHFAPWRQDPRPIEGLLHGTYAFLGITSYWRGRHINTQPGNRRNRAMFEFARWRHQIADAVKALLASGHLTETGTRLVRRIGEVTASWQDTPVPAEAQRLADQVVTDHRIIWRLANIRPAADAIAALATAWIAGRPCPVDPSMISGTVQGDGQLRPTKRTHLIQRRLDNPDSFPALLEDILALRVDDYRDLVAADVAYLSDDFPLAVSRYRDEINESPNHYQHWAGLAIAAERCSPLKDGASMLLDAPEVVHAVHNRIAADGGQAPDPVQLARWLASARLAATH